MANPLTEALGIFVSALDLDHQDHQRSRVSVQRVAVISGAVFQRHNRHAGISQGKDRPGEILNRWTVLSDLMETANVQAYISGHHHAWYSSRLGQIDLIQLGALGSGPRQLLQGGPPAQQTQTLLEIDREQNALTETTYLVSTGQPQLWSAIPPSLLTRRGVLRRNLDKRSLRS